MDEWENVTCTYFGGSFLNYSHLDVIAGCYASPAFRGECVLSTQARFSAYMHTQNYQLHAFLEFDREQLQCFYFMKEK